MRRAQLPVQYSQGFHPQPLLNFATALPVGIESVAEHADVVLYEEMTPEQFQTSLNAVMPEHLRVLATQIVPLQSPSLMSAPLAAQYHVEVPVHLLPPSTTALPDRIRELLRRDDIPMQRWHKKGPRQVNIRPGIVSLDVLPETDAIFTFEMLVREEPEAKAKPSEVIQALLSLSDNDLLSLRIHKREAFVREAARFVPVMRYVPQTEAHEVHI